MCKSERVVVAVASLSVVTMERSVERGGAHAWQDSSIYIYEFIFIYIIFFKLLFTVNTVHPQISMIQLLAQPQTGSVCVDGQGEKERAAEASVIRCFL